MSERRKDSKGRILREGESQRTDGRYMYRYTDIKGNRQTLYSWRLVDTDKAPAGKRSAPALRDLEKQVRRDTEDGIDTAAGTNTTLNDFYEDYIGTKIELKASTRTNYKYMYDKYVKDTLGQHSIASIRYSQIKKFYIHLICDLGFQPNSVEIIQTILHPVFNLAVKDGLIRTNPTDGVIAELKRSHDWDKPKRQALTIPEQERFISFVAAHKHYKRWMTLFTVMLGTGARIGEILALRWEDIDFKKNIIHVKRSLIYRVQELSGKVEFHISTPKTKAGIRIIPMFSAVKEALLSERERQTEEGFNAFIIDGYSHFIFSNRFDTAMSPHCVNRVLERIIRDANKEEATQAKTEHREPILLPHFTCHNLRHTFCTRLCENENNIKIIQEIMGHKNIETTMDVYNHATQEKKIETFANLEGKFRLA